MKGRRGVASALRKHAEICVTLIALALLIAIVVIWVVSSADLSAIRDYGLLIAAAVAFPLGFWRSRVAERQADAAHRQVETAEHGLLNERYQQGAEMLGSDVLSVRLGGIYALQRLANDYPEHYHIETMRLFCAFVRNPTGDAGGLGVKDSHGCDPMEEIEGPQLREDVQTIMNAIGSRSQMEVDIEKKNGYSLDLRGASLVGALLQHAKLSGADLNRANLRDAILTKADLSGTRFGMFLPSPPINGLTQNQLDKACADPNNPPKLNGVVDKMTNERLIWRGKPCDNAT